MQSDADRKRDRQTRSQAAGGGNEVERELRRHPRMVGARRWDAGDRHIVVADGLDLFDAGVLGEPVEFAEQTG